MTGGSSSTVASDTPWSVQLARVPQGLPCPARKAQCTPPKPETVHTSLAERFKASEADRRGSKGKCVKFPLGFPVLVDSDVFLAADAQPHFVHAHSPTLSVRHPKNCHSLCSKIRSRGGLNWVSLVLSTAVVTNGAGDHLSRYENSV